MEKKQYTKPRIEVRKLNLGATLLAASTPEFKTVLKYNIEGNIEKQEFNDNEFEASWGDSPAAEAEQ